VGSSQCHCGGWLRGWNVWSLCMAFVLGPSSSLMFTVRARHTLARMLMYKHMHVRRRACTRTLSPLLPGSSATQDVVFEGSNPMWGRVPRQPASQPHRGDDNNDGGISSMFMTPQLRRAPTLRDSSGPPGSPRGSGSSRTVSALLMIPCGLCAQRLRCMRVMQAAPYLHMSSGRNQRNEVTWGREYTSTTCTNRHNTDCTLHRSAPNPSHTHHAFEPHGFWVAERLRPYMLCCRCGSHLLVCSQLLRSPQSPRASPGKDAIQPASQPHRGDDDDDGGISSMFMTPQLRRAPTLRDSSGPPGSPRGSGSSRTVSTSLQCVACPPQLPITPHPPGTPNARAHVHIHTSAHKTHRVSTKQLPLSHPHCTTSPHPHLPTKVHPPPF
jgi:hypothetical protein